MRIEHASKLAFLFVCAVNPASAQVITGQITGRVTDPSGAVIPGVQVAIRNVETGFERPTQTNQEGYYTAPLLPPGTYRISVRIEGFRPAARSGLSLAVDQVARIDFALEVGGLAEAVEVSGAAPVVESESGALGTAVERKSIVDLPLNTRNPFQLALLTPGVLPAKNFGDAFNSSSRFQMNGGRGMTSDVQVDGISNATPGAFARTFIAIFPSPDSIQEFKVQSNSFSAEYGRTGGGIVNMILRSGTNTFHGSAHEFLRNSILDANDFFANRAGKPLASFKRNQFGGTFGGPIVRNKAFFFASYEGLRQRTQDTYTATMPTAQERTGDFSASQRTLGGACVALQIFDPATTRKNPSGTGSIRDQFPGNAIPRARLDAVGAKMASLYPLPNTAGDPCAATNNFFSAKTSKYKTDQVDGKFDWSPADRDRLSFGLSWYDNNNLVPDHFGTIASPNGLLLSGDSIPAKAGRFDYTRVQKPNLILNARFGAVRWERVTPSYPNDFHIASLGLPASLEQQMRQPLSYPVVGVAGYALQGNDTAAFIFQAGNSYTWRGGVTWIKGAHTLKFGGEFRVMQSYEYSGFRTHGRFDFSNAFTQGPDPNAAAVNRGNGVASMLVGLGSGSIQQGPPVYTSNHYAAAFVEDQWKVSRKLSLELGLRYDVETGRHERFNQASYFDFDSLSPLAAKLPGLPNLRGGLRFAGRDADGQFDTDWNNLGPRVGLAYSITPRMAIRTGYGIFYSQFVGTAIGGAAGLNGYDLTNTWTSSLDGITPLNYLSNPYPQGLAKASGNSLGLLSNVGQSLAGQRDGAIDRGSRVGYMQQWNFNLQRELIRGVALEAAYTGSRSVKMPESAGWAWNQLDPQYLALGPALQQLVPNPFLGIISSGALSQPTISRAQLLRPYPQFLDVPAWWSATDAASYHAFQLRVQKQFGGGSSGLIAYTTGKNIDDQGGFQNAYNRRAERSLSLEDISQRFVGSLVYQLPFGKGRHWGGGMPAWAGFVAGGWQANSIVTFSAGTPLAITASNTAGIFNSLTRPNVIGDPQLSGDRSKSDKLARWFNTAAFAQPAPFTFGNGSRTLPSVRSDGVKNLDLSLFKNFPIREWIRLEFRSEAFNLLNRAQFNAPGQGVGGAAFGVVSGQLNTPRQIQFALKLYF